MLFGLAGQSYASNDCGLFRSQGASVRLLASGWLQR